MKRVLFLILFAFAAAAICAGCGSAAAGVNSNGTARIASYVADSKVYVIGEGEDYWRDVTPVGAQKLCAVYFYDENDGWAVGSDDDRARTFIYKTADGGGSWSRFTLDYESYAAHISFVDNNDGYILIVSEGAASHEYAAVIKTTDGGLTWGVVSEAADDNPSIQVTGGKNGICFADDKNGWLTLDQPVSEAAYLLHTSDGGVSWESKTLKIPKKYDGYFLSALTPVFFDTKNGVLEIELTGAPNTFIFYSTRDGGANWTSGAELIQTREKGFYWYSFYDADNGFVTDGNILYRTNDGGKKWTSVNSDIGAGSMTGICFFDGKTGWIIAADGNLKTTDGGVTWETVEE